MPGRRYNNQLPPQARSKPQKSQRKQRKRAQNALSIAEAEHEDAPQMSRNRLANYDNDDNDLRKRTREDEQEGSEELGNDNAVPRKRAKHREAQGAGVEYGSDSEGNEWMIGQVDDEDDESLDSDEAFGDSDEERFEGFAFRGSKTKRKIPKKAHRSSLLDEGEDSEEQEEEDSDAESDNFAENAVDLHTMLDDNSEESEPEVEAKKLQRRTDDAADEYSSSDNDSDSEMDDKQSELSLEDDDDDAAADFRSTALQNMVASLGNGDQADAEAKKAEERAKEGLAPTNIVTQSGGLESMLDALDPETRRLLGAVIKPSKRQGKGIPGKVEAPLPQRQQARLDRAAAYEKSKETLARWIDTVKHNRRAEHLSFPLVNPDEASAKNIDKLKPLDPSKPFNDLEATIQSILIENGVKRPQGESQDDENEDEEEDELILEGAPAKAPSLEEVMAKRAELRRARELLFREEIKAKRIKKIKSRSYRKVHRKARERELQRQQEADTENGIEPDEDDQDRLDRLRAEERMGSKHRESKWAKAMKSTGRSAWDEDARSGMIDMARREEELKRRIHGQNIADDDNLGEDSASDAPESDEDGLRNELFKLREESGSSNKGSRLANMAFMKRAETAVRERNNETIAQIQRDLDGGESSDESEEEGPGRRIFGAQKNIQLPLKQTNVSKSEFEEREESEPRDFEDTDDEIQVTTKKPTNKSVTNVELSNNSSRKLNGPRTDEKAAGFAGDNSNNMKSFLNAASEKHKNTIEPAEGDPNGESYVSMLHATSNENRHKRPERVKPLADSNFDKSNRTSTVAGTKESSNNGHGISKAKAKQVRLLPPEDRDDDNDDDNNNDDDDNDANNISSSSGSDSDADSDATASKITTRQTELLRRAFAGDDAVASFEAEKAAVAADERTPPPEASADTMPGWGSWTGAGLAKRDRRERAQRNARIQQANAADRMAAHKGAKNGRKIDRTRRDADLDGVIISERRAPKTAKYRAAALPHPFETRAQYERSLRIPVGPEWTTKETFQTATKPRVLLGGGIVKPMEKPMI